MSRHQHDQRELGLVLLLMLLPPLVACGDTGGNESPRMFSDAGFPTEGDPPCPRRSDATYVRTAGPNDEPIYWSGGNVANCLPLAFDPVGTEDLPGDTEREVIWRATERWTTAAAACDAPLCFRDDGEVAFEDGIGYVPLGENSNIVAWVTNREDWDSPSRNASVIATTLISVRNSTGELLNADIEFNNVDFRYADGDPQQGLVDLESVAVHELGHYLGFDHTPDRRSVMFVHQPVGIHKRELDLVDELGLCDAYFCYETGE